MSLARRFGLTSRTRRLSLRSVNPKGEMVKAALPVQRAAGREAGFVSGKWSDDRMYSSADRGVQRSVFRPL